MYVRMYVCMHLVCSTYACTYVFFIFACTDMYVCACIVICILLLSAYCARITKRHGVVWAHAANRNASKGRPWEPDTSSTRSTALQSRPIPGSEFQGPVFCTRPDMCIYMYIYKNISICICKGYISTAKRGGLIHPPYTWVLHATGKQVGVTAGSGSCR